MSLRGACPPQMHYHLRALRRQFRAEIARVQARVDEVSREVWPPLPVAPQLSYATAPWSSVARPPASSHSPRAEPPSRDATAARSSSSRGASPRSSNLACAELAPRPSTSPRSPSSSCAGSAPRSSASPRSSGSAMDTRTDTPAPNAPPAIDIEGATATPTPADELQPTSAGTHESPPSPSSFACSTSSRAAPTEVPPRPDHSLRLGLREAAKRAVTMKATRIQVWWRGSLTRRTVKATRIQAWWRGLLARHPRLKANLRVAALAAVLFAPLQGLPDEPVKKRLGLTNAERRRAVQQATRSGRR